MVDGLLFDSKHEAERYRVLTLMQAAGEIQFVQCQQAFDLTVHCPLGTVVAGKSIAAVTIGRYIADFVYRDSYDVMHVEDAKGFRTPLYRWKKRHFEAEYGIRIEEV